jgi:hypothetical protein
MRAMRIKEERMKEIRVTCFSCNEEKTVTLTDEQYTRYLGWKTGVIPHIQDALPDVPAGKRELLISGMCEECWDRMIGEDEEDPEDE